MAKSLQDQLLEAGAIKKDRAVRIKKAKHKQAKQRARGAGEPDEVKLAAQRAQAEKAERDRALSRERQAALEHKAIAAQIRQLIETNRIDEPGADLSYHFTKDGVVRTILTTSLQQGGLAAGRLAIARLDEAFVLIPEPVAAKIRERDPGVVVVTNVTTADEPDDDDPYAEYTIPDDLTW